MKSLKTQIVEPRTIGECTFASRVLDRWGLVGTDRWAKYQKLSTDEKNRITRAIGQIFVEAADKDQEVIEFSNIEAPSKLLFSSFENNIDAAANHAALLSSVSLFVSNAEIEGYVEVEIDEVAHHDGFESSFLSDFVVANEPQCDSVDNGFVEQLIKLKPLIDSKKALLIPKYVTVTSMATEVQYHDEGPGEHILVEANAHRIEERYSSSGFAVEDVAGSFSTHFSAYTNISKIKDSNPKLNTTPIKPHSDQFLDWLTNLKNVSLLKADLPVLQNATLEDILSIRLDESEAFHNFLNSIDSLLMNIDTIQRENEVKILFSAVNHNVRELEERYKKLLRRSNLDIVLGTLSLGLCFLDPLVGSLASFITGSKSLPQIWEYMHTIRGARKLSDYYVPWQIAKQIDKRNET